jgi:hypothetical protein
VASIALSIAALGVVAYFTLDLPALRDALTRAEAGFLAAAVGCVVLRVVAGGWRLNVLSDYRLGLRDSVRGRLAWEFFTAVTPSVIGGGPITGWYLARDRRDLSTGEVSAVMLLAMLFDQLWFALVILLALGGTLYADVLPDAGFLGRWSILVALGGLLVWAVLFAYMTLIQPRLVQKLAAWIFQLPVLRRYRWPVLREMQALADQAAALRNRSLLFYLHGFVWTAVVWIGRYFVIFFIIWSVYPSFDGPLLLVRAAVLSVCGLLLPTPGGAGGFEGLYVLMIGPLIPAALVTPTLLTWRLLSYYVFIALGAYLFLHELRRLPADDAPSTRSSTGAPSPGAADVSDPQPASSSSS